MFVNIDYDIKEVLQKYHLCAKYNSNNQKKLEFDLNNILEPLIFIVRKNILGILRGVLRKRVIIVDSCRTRFLWIYRM